MTQAPDVSAGLASCWIRARDLARDLEALLSLRTTAHHDGVEMLPPEEWQGLLELQVDAEELRDNLRAKLFAIEGIGCQNCDCHHNREGASR